MHVTSDKSGFFSWWSRELAGLLPSRAPRGPEFAKRRVIVAVSEGRVRWLEESDQGLKPLGPETASFTPDAQTLKKLNSARLRNAPLGLRLEKRDALERRASLPETARANFPRILSLEVERATPFKAADVYSAFIEDKSAPPAKGKVALRQFIVKRELLDGPRAALEAHDFTAEFADLWDEKGERGLRFNLLAPTSEAGQSVGRKPLMRRVLALAVVALAGAGAWLTIERNETALAALDKEIAAARAKSQAMRNDIGKAQAALDDAKAIENLRHSRITPAEAIEELTRILPDDTHLTDLSLSGRKLVIGGLAKNANALLPLIEKSDAFEAVEMTAPVVLDSANNKEQFRIEARLSLPSPGPAKSDTDATLKMTAP